MTREEAIKRLDEQAFKELEQEPCGKDINVPATDCISRQVAIDSLGECPMNWTDSDAEIASERDWKDTVNMLKRLPSVIPTQKWIPVSERLPNDRDWYLGTFKEADTGWINPLPFICDYVGSETRATTKEHWILHGFTDRDEHIDYYFNLECVAWMPLPKPYKTESEDKK